MTGPTYAPIFLGACSIMINSVEYGPIVSSAALKPTQKTATFQGLDGTVTNFAGKPQWSWTLNIAQDFTPSAGLGQYLLANAGTKVVAVLTPVAGGPIFTQTITLVAPDIGGAASTIAESSITFLADGQPVQS